MTKADVDRIQACSERGMTLAQIGQESGFSRWVVRYWAVKLGLTIRSDGEAKYTAPMSDRQPAPRPLCVVCEKAPRRYRRLTCGAPACNTKKLHASKYPAELIERVREWREGQGAGIKEIARRLHLGVPAVKGICERAGIKLRAASDPSELALAVVVAAERASERPIAVYPREVRYWGMIYNVPLKDRGDIAAVSAAAKSAEPGHPGFVPRAVVVPRPVS